MTTIPPDSTRLRHGRTAGWRPGWMLAAILAVLVARIPAGLAEPQQGDAAAIARCGLYAYAAHITEVYDGDTVTADIDLGFKVWRKDEKLRLLGIDAPELRGRSRAEGLKSRDALRARVLGKDVIVCTFKDKTGKYGRYLAELYVAGENINEWLVSAGHAVPYGEAKQADLAGLRDVVDDLLATFSMQETIVREPRFQPALLPHWPSEN